MIERVWRGWTDPDKADDYQHFLQHELLPDAHAIRGYLGAQVLRREICGEVEFMTITRFASIEAIRAFAGADEGQADIAPRARELLSRWEERTVHYELAFEDQPRDAA